MTAAYIRRKQDNSAGIGIKPWIPLNRWSGPGDYSIMTEVTGTVEYTVQTTVDPVNRPDIIPLSDVLVCPVTNAVGLVGPIDCLNINLTPLEAIRIEQTSGTGSVSFRILQNGEG